MFIILLSGLMLCCAAFSLLVAPDVLALPGSQATEDDDVRDVGSRLELFVDDWLTGRAIRVRM